MKTNFVTVKIAFAIAIVLATVSCSQREKSHLTLNDFLARRKVALVELQKTPADRLPLQVLRAQTTAEQRAGVRRIRIREFQIISDSPYTFAGYDLGPSSPQSTLGAIASDIADTYLSRAALKGIKINSLTVEVASRPNLHPEAQRTPYPDNLLYTLYIVSPATDAELEEVRLETEKYSPVYHLVTDSQTVKGEIDYEATPKDLTFKPPYQPGLREYLKYKRAALLLRRDVSARTDRDIPRQASDRKGLRAFVTVDPGTGIRRVHLNQFLILHDNSATLAGNNLAPNGYEHILGTLTSCITHISEIQAASHEFVLDTLQISAKADFDLKAGRKGFEDVPFNPHNIEITWHIKAPIPYDSIVALRNYVETVCPIYNLYKDAVSLEGLIVRGQYEDGGYVED